LTPRYVRTDLTRRDKLSAAAASLMVATGTGIIAFYLARLFLARDVVGDAGEAESKDVVAR
jgi:hypothetical protein